jgi:hypothetical protein
MRAVAERSVDRGAGRLSTSLIEGSSGRLELSRVFGEGWELLAQRFAANKLAQLCGLARFRAEALYLAELVAGQLGLDVVLVWWSAVAVAAYLELARLREGVAPRDVVEVFA